MLRRFLDELCILITSRNMFKFLAMRCDCACSSLCMVPLRVKSLFIHVSALSLLCWLVSLHVQPMQRTDETAFMTSGTIIDCRWLSRRVRLTLLLLRNV